MDWWRQGCYWPSRALIAWSLPIMRIGYSIRYEYMSLSETHFCWLNRGCRDGKKYKYSDLIINCADLGRLWVYIVFKWTPTEEYYERLVNCCVSVWKWKSLISGYKSLTVAHAQGCSYGIFGAGWYLLQFSVKLTTYWNCLNLPKFYVILHFLTLEFARAYIVYHW